MLEWLVTPLAYTFMQRGLLASLIVGVVCAVIGCYVVLRGMAFLGDALAHAILPGIAIAYLLQGSLIIGALVAAVAVALLIGLFSRQGTIREDTAIGILFAAALSLGVALISSIRTYAVDLTHILFGNVLGVSPSDLWLAGGLGLFVLIAVVVLYKPFLVISFDPVLAATLRWPAELLRNVLLDLACVNHRCLITNRWRRTGGSHAGHTGSHRLSTDPPSACDDGNICADRSFFQPGWAVSKLLCQYRLGFSGCADSYHLFFDYLFICTAPRNDLATIKKSPLGYSVILIPSLFSFRQQTTKPSFPRKSADFSQPMCPRKKNTLFLIIGIISVKWPIIYPKPGEAEIIVILPF